MALFVHRGIRRSQQRVTRFRGIFSKTLVKISRPKCPMDSARKYTMKGTSKSSPQSGEKRVSQVVFADSAQSQPSLKISEILVRQRWVILGAMSLGLALASLYWSKARVWYESSAKVLVSQRDPTLASGDSKGESMVDEDVLANHMEVVRSRRIVEGALKRHDLTELPSILEQRGLGVIL
jgi:hypothetical protein